MSEAMKQSGHFERRTMTTTDRDGRRKQREIMVPDEKTLAMHHSMLQYFYDFHFVSDIDLPPSTFVRGGLPDASLIDNVIPHLENKTFFKLDIKDAFPSVDTGVLLRKLYLKAPDADKDDIIAFFKNYATTPEVEGLPLGAPCSPYLFNFYCQDMDAALSAFCEEHGYAYSRWLDDITVSSPGDKSTLGAGMRRKIINIIEASTAFSINHAKSQLHSRERMPVTITGISLYPDGRVQPKPQVLQDAFAAFDEIETDIVTLAPIGETHLARLNGHHGALVGMSLEPYGETMQGAFERYRAVSELARSAIAQQDEPPFEPSYDRRRIIEGMIAHSYHQTLQNRAASQPDTVNINDGNW